MLLEIEIGEIRTRVVFHERQKHDPNSQLTHIIFERESHNMTLWEICEQDFH